jgi:transposase
VLPEDHRARWLETYVDELNLSDLEEAYLGRGSAAYRPDLLLKVVLYEILNARRSPAQWARDVRENVALLWLGRGIQPSRTALYNFRDRVGPVIDKIHAALVRQTMAEGLVHPEEGVQDGTTVRACASRHRLLNRDTLLGRRRELQAVRDQDGVGQRPESLPRWMAKTPAGRGEQSQRYAQAQEVLERRLAANSRRPKGKRLPERKVTVSTSDPEAPVGRDKEKVVCPLYTAQFLVEPNSTLTLSFEVFARATDAGTLPPMLDKTKHVIGRYLRAVNADAAYGTLLDLQECARRGVELVAPVQENNLTHKKPSKREEQRQVRERFVWLPEEKTYRCPQGHRLTYKGRESKRRRDDQTVIEYRYHCPPESCCRCPFSAGCVRNPQKGRTIKRLEGQELLDAHRAKMETEEAKTKRKRRGELIERPFADAKEHRNLRKLHGRGLNRARAEIGLAVLAQTLLTIQRLRCTRANLDEDDS